MTIDKDDLDRLEDNLSAAMREGFMALNQRLDVLNGRTRKNETDIAVLQAYRATALWVINGVWAFVLILGEWLLHGRK